MKVRILLVASLLPFTALAQFSSSRALIDEYLKIDDASFFQQQLLKTSPVLQHLAVSYDSNVSEADARALIEEKLKELNNDQLNEAYAQLSPENLVRAGITLYLIMGILSNLQSGYDAEAKIGGGVGVYLMYTIASLLLMPELSGMLIRFGEKGTQYTNAITYRLFYLTLALTTVYMVNLSQGYLLLGLSPLLGYALSGSWKDNGSRHDLEFGDNQTNRIYFALGVVAGFMLQNSMIVRLQYNFGISSLYENADPRISAFLLALSIPLNFGKE